MTDAYVPLTGPPTWQHAACRGEDPELWFPLGDTGRLHTNPHGETAVDICNRCDHAAECVAWAVHTNSEASIWGGKRPAERDPALARRLARRDAERNRRKRRQQQLDNAITGWI